MNEANTSAASGGWYVYTHTWLLVMNMEYSNDNGFLEH